MMPLEELRQLIGQLGEDQLKGLKEHILKLSPHPLEVEWGVDAETILTAIERSSDLTRRGVRGIIAEAVFERFIVTELARFGWERIVVPKDRPYDSHLQSAGLSARIQIKLQRSEKSLPKLYYPNRFGAETYYVVEVQKTRGGKKKTGDRKKGIEAPDDILKPAAELTRPYRFTDFDILGVNMHPSSRDWKDFRFTVAAWLLPRPGEPDKIAIFQPVARNPNNVWTNDLRQCLDWLRSGDRRSVL